MNEAVAERKAQGLEVVDFGMGDPVGPTGPRIVAALREGIRQHMGYPAAGGLPELREAIVGWARRRFDVELDPDTQVVPTLGSKEAIYLFAQVVLDAPARKDTAVFTEPGYPVYERGALFADGRIETLPLFIAGDPALVAALKAFRPTIRTAPQEFVQRASVVAWGDEEHVARARLAYSETRAVTVEALERAGLRVAGGTATMYVWVAVPGNATSESFASRLLAHGIVVAPGSFLGPSGEGYIRLALVPTLEECARAAKIFENAL